MEGEAMQGQCCKGGKKSVKIVGIIALTLIVLGSIFQDTIYEKVNPSSNTIQVVGRGKVPARPDAALLNLVVNTVLVPTPEEAIAQTTEKITKVKGALLGMGIAAEDFQLTGYVLNPRYATTPYNDGVVYTDEKASSSANIDRERQKPVVLGYDASQQLTIRLRGIDADTTLLDRVLSETTKLGVNQVGEAKFIVLNIEKLKQDARVIAIRDMNAKSQDIATAANVKIGKISSWYETVQSAPGEAVTAYYGDANATSKTVPPTGVVTPSPGELEVIVEISASYEVK